MRPTSADATKRALVTTAAMLFAVVFARLPAASAAPASTRSLLEHYRTVERAYRENRWSLLNGIVTSDFRYVEVDGSDKNVAGLERDASAFARQGGRIRTASVRVTSVVGDDSTRRAIISVALDVGVGRSGSTRVAQVDTDRDTWRLTAGRWRLSRTVVMSEAVTRFGNPSQAAALKHWPHDRGPDLGKEYAIIDRAFRESDWDIVRPFATSDARFIEVDGSSKTLDDLTAAGKAFTAAGGKATSTHMLPIHVVQTGTSASVAVLTTAAGTYPAGARRVRFAQRVAQQDTWRHSNGRWLYAGGRILRQTITTYAPNSSK